MHNIDHKQINDTTPIMASRNRCYNSEFFKLNKTVFLNGGFS
jgi:hypothetical protein